MTNLFIVPPIEITRSQRATDIGHQADGAAIVFEGIQPDPSRAWYKHCYGVRGFVWAFHGSFERAYYISPDYVDGALREHLDTTIVSLWAVIKSELEAAIAAPNAYGEAWQQFHRERLPAPPQREEAGR